MERRIARRGQKRYAGKISDENADGSRVALLAKRGEEHRSVKLGRQNGSQAQVGLRQVPSLATAISQEARRVPESTVKGKYRAKIARLEAQSKRCARVAIGSAKDTCPRQPTQVHRIPQAKYILRFREARPIRHDACAHPGLAFQEGLIRYPTSFYGPSYVPSKEPSQFHVSVDWRPESAALRQTV